MKRGSQCLVTVRVPLGLRPDYLVNRGRKKNEQPLGEKNSKKSRNSPCANNGGV